MATITSFTAERILQIEAATIVDARIENGHLIFTTHGGQEIDTGNVLGNLDQDIANAVNRPGSSSGAAVAALAEARAAAVVEARSLPLLGPRMVHGDASISGFDWNYPSSLLELKPELFITADNQIRGSIGPDAKALFDRHSTARITATTFHISGTGNDSNTGRSAAQAVRSFRVLHQKINTEWLNGTINNSNGVRVEIDFSNPDAFHTVHSWETDAGQTTPILTHVAYVAVNVPLDLQMRKIRPMVGPWLELSMARDSSFPQTFSQAYSLSARPPIRVMDMNRKNALGLATEVQRVGSAAECNATRDSWFYDSAAGRLYINRWDNSFPRSGVYGNTLVTTHRTAYNLTNPLNLYFSGFAIVGGRGAAGMLIAPSEPSTGGSWQACVLEEMDLLYPGGYAGPASNGTADNISAARYHGIVAGFDSRAYGAAKDNWNLHQSTASDSFLVTVNCEGYGAGWSRAEEVGNSLNNWTLHQGAKGMSIADKFLTAGGGNVRNIDSSQMYMFGTQIGDDYGDGTIDPSLIALGGTSRAWLDHVFTNGFGGQYGLNPYTAGSKIHVKNYFSPLENAPGPGEIVPW